MNADSSILILGLGNELLCDDAIGIRLAVELEEHYRSPQIDFKTSCNGGLEIVELISNYKQVIIIDAIKTKNGIPGNISYFTPSDLNESLHVSSFHDVSFLTALKLMNYVGVDMPESIHILAIEIVEDMLFSSQFSRAIRKRYPAIRARIKRHLDTLLTVNCCEKRSNTTISTVSNTWN
jgi:hydrogenase maturation protease